MAASVILHFHCGTTIDPKRSRAIAQTKMTISQRVTIDDVLCDVVCTGRFYFFLEKRKGRWSLVLFQPIFEKDRLDRLIHLPRSNWTANCLRISPKDIVTLRAGHQVKTDMPGLDGPELEAVYGRG